MSRWEAWCLHLATLLVTGTGLAYAWARYVAETDDPFAIAHPLQAPTQHLHVLVAPLLVFAVGVVWKEHVWDHFRDGKRRSRRSGVSLLATVVPMVASGYLIQTTVTPAWRTAWIVVHLATSALWVSAYAAHAWIGLRQTVARRRRRRVEVSDLAAQAIRGGASLETRN